MWTNEQLDKVAEHTWEIIDEALRMADGRHLGMTVRDADTISMRRNGDSDER